MSLFGTSVSSTSSSSKSTGAETSNTNTRRLSDADYESLSATLRRMQSGSEEEDAKYSKEAAIRDTKGLVDSIFSEYRKTDLPQIMEQQGKTGGYSSSGAQLLSNDAFATATNKAASTVLGAIQGYSQIQNDKRQTSIQGLSSILSGLLQARESSTVDSVFSTNSSSKAKGKSASLSLF